VVFWLIPRLGVVFFNHTTPFNYQKDHRLHQHRGGSLKSKNTFEIVVLFVHVWPISKFAQVLPVFKDVYMRNVPLEDTSTPYIFQRSDRQNPQNCSLNIYITISLKIFLHVSIHKGSSSVNQPKQYCIKLN
jgi:hypothetical protein